MRLFAKTLLPLTLALSLCSGVFNVYAADTGWNSLKGAVALKIGSPKAFVRLEEKNIDPANPRIVPFVKDGRTLLPIRFISESFGAKVAWDDVSATATVVFGGSTAKIILGSDRMVVNGHEILLDVPAELTGNRVYIPLRRLCEDVLGKQVFYDSGIIVLTDTVWTADSAFFGVLKKSFKDTVGRLNYMVYYGKLDAEKTAVAKTYDLVILHPLMGDLTREQVQDIRRGVDPDDPGDDVIVLGYISVGEDMRTASLTEEQILTDPRFKGDGTGPRVDPRGPHPNGGGTFDNVDRRGAASPGGGGFASYFLDDNDFNGIPDINKHFKGAFVNAGDPAWFETVSYMTIDSADNLPGLKEIMTDSFGRSLGCDGVFLDTIDTCAPNSYTDASSFNQSEFEWTAPGFSEFIARVRDSYPGKYVLQNRGLFFFDPRLPHYQFCTRQSIDFLMFESYRLDSDPSAAFNAAFFRDNKHAYMPKIMAEAGRADGFKVLSLGYAAGSETPTDTLTGRSQQGMASFLEDIRETEEIAGFNHYITDGGVLLVNDFVRTYANINDTDPPVWSATYNASPSWPPYAPAPRTGIQQAVAQRGGVVLRWDVALDKNRVRYVAYYQNKPFDFQGDPKLSTATKQFLIPSVGEGYSGGVSPTTFPYEAVVDGLTPGETYYFVIRAADCSPAANEDANQVVLTATPL